MEAPWILYIISNRQFTYVGVSPDPTRRLRQHNGEICGGAKYTTSKGAGWKHVCTVSGFRTKIEALQFEWAVKHVPPRDAGGIKNRIRKLFTLFGKERSTPKLDYRCCPTFPSQTILLCPPNKSHVNTKLINYKN